MQMFTLPANATIKGSIVPAALIGTCMIAFECVREGGDGGGAHMMMFTLAHLTVISWEEEVQTKCL